jgi:putative ATP-binding cassette transporter
MKNAFLKLISFYLGGSWRIVVPAMAIGILAGATSATMLALISVKVSNPESTTSAFIWAFSGLALFDMLAVIGSGLLSTHLAQNTTFDLRMRLSRKVLSAPLRQLEKVGEHRVMAVLTQDIPDIIQALMQVPQLCIHAAVLTGCLVYLGLLSPGMLGALVVLLALAMFTVILLDKRAKVHMRMAREKYDGLIAHLQALTDGAKELKLHRARRETFVARLLEPSAREVQQHNLKGGFWYAILNGWMQVIYFVIISTVLFALPYFTSGAGRSMLTAYALTILYMRGHIIGVMLILPSIGRANVALRKVEEVGLSLDELDAKPDVSAPSPHPAWEHLEMKGVSHTYAHEKDDSNFVLGPIDLSLRPGNLIFIIGGNGSGKTTLAKILTGLYIPEGGELLIDGESVSQENRDNYRQLFSVVFSDFYLFDRLLGLDEVNLDERAREYLNQFHLQHKVKVQDGKLSTTNLSYGQRKRLALLTAYLEDRPIYVFDEWASGQDPIFREIFYLQLLPELKEKGKTVIVISHDDYYYHVADRIIKLDDGKVNYDQPIFDPASPPHAATAHEATIS